MSRVTAGHTPLGKAINNISGVTNDTLSKQRKVIVGILEEVYFEKSTGAYRYNYKVKYKNSNNQIVRSRGFLELEMHAESIAMNHGEPESLVGYKCVVEYNGITIERGKIIKILDLSSSDTERIISYNKVDITGTAFAPPGGTSI